MAELAELGERWTEFMSESGLGRLLEGDAKRLHNNLGVLLRQRQEEDQRLVYFILEVLEAWDDGASEIWAFWRHWLAYHGEELEKREAQFRDNNEETAAAFAAEVRSKLREAFDGLEGRWTPDWESPSDWESEWENE